MTTGEARKAWATVLRSARRGTPVVITSHGRAIAAVVSIDQLKRIPAVNAPKPTLAEALAEWRAGIDPRDLAGPDPWANIRSKSTTGGRPPIDFKELFPIARRSRARRRAR